MRKASRRTSAALIATAGLVIPLAVTSAPAAFASVTKWVTISATNVGTTATTPSIARFGNTYQVIWVEEDSGTSWAIRSRILNAAGKPVGGQITALSHWAGIALDPTILAGGGALAPRLIAFGGSKTGTSGPYDTDAEYLLTSTNGKSWTLAPGSLSAADGASNGSAAVVNDGGTLITALAKGDSVVYHVGKSPDSPAPGTDPVTATTGNFSADPGLGVDKKTHKVWTVWYSNSGISGQDGTNAQQIYPTLGSRVHAPNSSDSTNSLGAQQDLSVAARTKGGLYTAYRPPPDAKSAAVVWKLGASKPVAIVKDVQGVSHIVLTPGPKGRLWLYWTDGDGWRATRSNKAATRFGPVLKAKVPKNAIENGQIAAVGSAGPLEAVATDSTNGVSRNNLIARQFLPKLAIKAPKSVARGNTLTVKVTDVGDAVKGAKVSFDGVSAKTNKHGVASLKIPHSAATGKHKATARSGGYAAASRTVSVKS